MLLRRECASEWADTLWTCAAVLPEMPLESAVVNGNADNLSEYLVYRSTKTIIRSDQIHTVVFTALRLVLSPLRESTCPADVYIRSRLSQDFPDWRTLCRKCTIGLLNPRDKTYFDANGRTKVDIIKKRSSMPSSRLSASTTLTWSDLCASGDYRMFLCLWRHSTKTKIRTKNLPTINYHESMKSDQSGKKLKKK